MRALTFVAGLVGFAAIASGAPTAPQFIAKSRDFTGQYSYGDQPFPFSVTRKFKFTFLDSETQVLESEVPDSENPELYKKVKKTVLKADPATSIKEYLLEDVIAAKGDASKLKNLRVKTVDCRLVTRQMVEHLIGSRVEVQKTGSGVDGESHRYQERTDQLDTALVANQLDSVIIGRDQTMNRYASGDQVVDPDANFTCTPSGVDGDTAKCGRLNIWFNPQPARKGPYKGQNAIVFDRQSCDKYSDEMGLASCELIAQIQGCGLRYTQKAVGPKAGKPFQCDPYVDPGIPDGAGLSDVLTYNADKDHCLLRKGRYHKEVPEVSAPESSDGGNGSSAPSSFYDDFKSPQDAR